MARQPIEGNRKRFQLKLIEMLGKGFREKEHHDFVSDVEQSRAAYKINKGEVEYFVMRALLSLPVLTITEAFLMTMREVLEFYQQTLLKLINSFVSKMECLRAIEDANLECDHLKFKETSAFLVHFLILADILDGETVMQFYRNLQERNSYLASQDSFRMMITWLQDEAAKKRLEQRRRLIEWSQEDDDDDDVPLSHALMKSMERAFNMINVKPLCVWAMKADDIAYQKYKPLLLLVRKNETDEQSDEEDDDDDVPLSNALMKSIERAFNMVNIKPLCVWSMRDRTYQNYKPLLLLVMKNEAEAASNDTDEQSDEEDDDANTNDDSQNENENEEENPEQHYGEIEQSDVEDQDDDEDDEIKDFSGMDSEDDDIPLAYLRNLAKNMKKVVRL